MRFWGSKGAAAEAAPAVRHDAEHVQVLRLMVTDTFQWKCDWANWRIRFEYDAHTSGHSLQEVAAFVVSRALPLCQNRAEAHANVLYLREEYDIGPVFDAFGAVGVGLGQISALQSRDAYEDAVRIAAMLAERGRPKRHLGDDPLAMPDLTWHVSGTDQFRVARTRVDGKEIVVRFGYLGGHEMWVVDVNGKANCAHFRARADAMSKIGVGVALETYRGQSKR